MTSQESHQIVTTVGQNIRLAREARGLNQRELASLIGVGESHVSRWEMGRHVPVLKRLTSIARELHRDVGWFYVDHSADLDRERAA